jgi:arabinofuranosyltransferase
VTGQGRDERALAARGERDLAVAVLLVVYAVVVVRTAWVMDDAYISFRSVDNAIHGFGLRWNTFERVDAFTNPLWTLMMCAFSLFTREVFYTGLGLQITLSIVAAYVVARTARSTFAACASVAALTLSKAFVDYSTSGLENPLSHLLVALFAALYLGSSDASPRALGRLTGIASLALVNRLDLIWLLLPCLTERAVAAWRTAPSRDARRAILVALAAGMLPLIGWELFSFFYYGAWIPNSALAKLTSHVSRRTLLWDGASLVRDSLVVDPLTLVGVAAGVLFGVFHGSSRDRVLAGGVAATLAYVVWVGGDHMSGRFFSVSFLVAVVLLGRRPSEPSRAVGGTVVFAGLAAAWMAGLPTLNDQAVSQRPACDNDIEDYQREWHPKTGLLTRGLFARGPTDDWVDLGKAAREHPKVVPVWGGIGLAGYYSGPAVRVLDQYGLSDPLLARLPIPDAKHEAYFKVGHFMRSVPDGYVETIRDGRNQIRHHALKAYYDKLALVTQGPLWSWRRLVEAFKLNLGAYDSLLAEYTAYTDQKPIDVTDLPPATEKHDGNPMRDCPSWWRPCAESGVAFTPTGVRVKLGRASHAARIEADLTPGEYDAVFWRDETEIVRTGIEGKFGERTTVEVDPVAARIGFDAVSFLPRKAGDDARLLTYFELVVEEPR